MTGVGRPHVLVVSQNYPSTPRPDRGLWVERMVRVASDHVDQIVVSPLPLTHGRHAHGRELDNALPVYHPPVLGGITSHLHAADARLNYPVIRRLTDRLHAERAFDLIHAHFIYPDGVVAARLGQRYGIPVMTTEHAFWRPWFESHPRVGRQVMAALPRISLVTGVSDAVRRQIHEMVGDAVRTDVLHNVLDDGIFHATSEPPPIDIDRLLFVGFIRHVKGLDVLLHAMRTLVATRPRIRLEIIGDSSFFRAYREEERRLRALADTLDLADRIRWVGRQDPRQVADAMRRSAVVVVPSRRETFSSVAAEALACGAPVVATRCGGPQEIVGDDDGILVDVEAPDQLAAAIGTVIDRRATYDPRALSERAIARFGREATARRIAALYSSLR